MGQAICEISTVRSEKPPRRRAVIKHALALLQFLTKRLRADFAKHAVAIM